MACESEQTVVINQENHPVTVSTRVYNSDDEVAEDMSDASSFIHFEDSNHGSPETNDDSDALMTSAMEDEVTAQLAVSGRAGIAAAAAILSVKKKKKMRPFKFELNPALRKRKQTRLLRTLSQVLDELTTTVGSQAVVLVAKPGVAYKNFTCFGSQPLEDVVRNMRPTLMQHLDNALERYSPPETVRQDSPDSVLHELPPLLCDGIPTPVEQMTQSQLRTFIPFMLKYSTGRTKPGWGKEDTRPPWWPQDVPWENIRVDIRTKQEKRQVSWNHALQQIVINCYVYHGREDLLPVFGGESEKCGEIRDKDAPNLVLYKHEDGEAD